MQYSVVLNRLQNLTNKKITQAELCKVLNIKSSAMGNRQRRNSDFSTEEIEQINIHYNVDLFNNITQYVSKIEDCTEIPVRGNVTASMGYGLTVYDETQTGTYAINNKLARDLGINLQQSEIIFAKGDSMEPTIIGGDSLLVDLTRKEVHDGSIYCVRIDGELYAKRLQKIPPFKIKVISDNKEKYDPFYIDLSKNVDFDFEIIGEIRWWGRVAR